MSKREPTEEIVPAESSTEFDDSDSTSLLDWLDQFDHDERLHRVLNVSRQILLKLSSLHAQCQVHGFLTPDAVRISSRTTEVRFRAPRELDLKTLSNAESMREACYLAPEQTGVLSRSSSPATDLYSVGLLIYRMISGRNPLQATNLNDLLIRQTTWAAPSLRHDGFDIPRPLDEMILRLVKRDSMDRYQKTDSVIYDVDLILESLSSNHVSDSLAIGTFDTREKFAEPSFVGRSSWIANFVRRINADLRISLSPWVIRGAAGEGKSRLLQEFANVAACHSTMVLRAAGARADHSRPLEAIAKVFQDLETHCLRTPQLRHRLKQSLASHAFSLQPLMPWLWEASEIADTESGPESFAGRRLKQALQELLLTISRLDHRTVLLIDDLDRCDDISKGLFLEWIQAQQQQISGRLMLVASSTIPGSRLFSKETGVLLESLAALSQVETTQLLRSMAGDFPKEAVDLIANAACGNPYMSISLLYGMLESGTAVSTSGGWHIKSLSMESLQGHRTAGRDIEARLKSLSPACRQFLTAAAILGRNCDLNEARRLARLNDPDAQSGLETAVQRQLIWMDTTRQSLGFVHESVRQSFLDELRPRDRIALHLRSARMIQRGSKDRCYELAYHFDAAGRVLLAIEFSLQAARKSQLQFASDLAIRYYTIALRWIPFDDIEMIARVKEELAEVHLSIGGYDSAEESLQQSLRESTDQISKTRITGKLGDVEFKRGKMQNAAELYSQALTLSGVRIPRTATRMMLGLLAQVAIQSAHSIFGLPRHRRAAEPLRRLRWRLQSRMGHTYWFSRGALWTLFAHLLTMNEAECYEDSPELAKTYSEHAPVCSLLRFFRRAEEYSKRSLRIRVSMNDIWGQGQTLSYLSVVLLAEPRFEQCVKVSMQAVELLQRTGDAWETNMARYQGANALYRLGRYREAAEHAQQMHFSGVEIDDAQASGISLDVLMRAAPSMVSDSVVEAQAAILRTDAQSHAQTQLGLAILRLRQDRYQEAVDILVEAIECCRESGHLNTYISPCYAWLATARRQLLLATPLHNVELLNHRRRLAREAVRRCLRVASTYRADLPHALRERAWLCVLDGQLSQSQRYFAKSIKAASCISSPMEEYETLRCMLDIAQDIGEAKFLVSIEQRQRFRELQMSLADSIALVNVFKNGQASLSLVDRFDKLLEDGRRIAGSLSKESIFSEGCLAAQHLLRGQMIFLFEKSITDDRWTVAHHLKSQASAEQIPNVDDYQRIIVETCEGGGATVFATDSQSGLSHGSLLAVPIRIRDVIVACLAVEHTELEQFFGEAELQVAEFIATLTGAALENAEGFANLRDLNTNLEQRVATRTEELHDAMAVAVAASQAKSQFFATMSHEVRTPLNGILGMTRLALAKCLDSQQTNYLSTIQRSGESLLQLLNDLLDFSKLEADKMTVESIPFDPRQMLGDVIGMMSVPAWQKGLEVIVNFDPRLPEQVLGDGVRLRQIVSNLIGNAIKFTSVGHIEIRVEILDSNESIPGKGSDLLGAEGLTPFRVDSVKRTSQWRLSVIDTGIGIPKSKQESIFEAFSQADGTTTRRFGGTGLGLSISLELVRLMHGTIELKSDEGIGSQFAVVLPLEASPNPISTQLHSCRLPKMKILVLEPQPVARRSLERLLESWGATTVVIDRWSELEDRESIDIELFDLAILAGPEALDLADRTRCAGLVTWIANPPDALPIGGTTNLSKPVLPSDLVRHFVGLSPTCRMLDTKIEVPVKSLKAAETKESNAGLRVLVAEDGEINRMVLVGLLELLGHSATVVENGLQATQRVNEDAFDICLMDLDMPEMDGIQATRVIRSEGNPLIIYAMTAHHDEEHANLCRDAGMNGYLTKPIQADQLKQILSIVATSKAFL